MMRTLLLLLAVAACLGGCGRGDNRFLGKWTFDRDYTVAHLPKETPRPSVKAGTPEAADIANGVNGVIDGLKPMLSQQLIGQMDGQTFNITPKVITDSSGTARTYQVVERTTPNDVSLKLSNGDLWTLTMEDGRITIPTTGGVHFKMYFKRADS